MKVWLDWLYDVMNLPLVPEDVTALNQRTEGWIVGLQMAALALQGKSQQQDASAFVQAFSGSHHYILDYLVEEVLAYQPDEIQTFLLQTSILSRLTGPLCDAVRFGVAESHGRDDGQATLEALDTANLFLVPLDDERRWYRYHHLFAEVLRARLQRTAGKGGLAPLHTRAAEWYEDHGEVNEAFKHAIAAQDFERAARLIEENWLQMGHAGQMNTVLRWLQSMPDEVIRARPMLSGAYAWGLAVWRDGDPWTAPCRYNRNATCLYPGGRPESKDPRLVPGISLEQNRDGIEDYEYVAMLRKLPGDKAKELAARCEKLYKEQVGARTDFSTVDKLRDLRREMAKALEKTQP